MTYTCLRCDWQGRTDGSACPECGARPLYVIGDSPAGPSGMRGSDQPDGGTRAGANTPNTPPSTARSPDPEPVPSSEAVEPSSGSARWVTAFVGLALVSTVALGTWLKAHEERPTPTGSTDASVIDTPEDAGSPTPAVGDIAVDTPAFRAFRRRTVIEATIPFSFKVPTMLGWERFSSRPTSRSPAGPISLNRSVTGPQGAEIMIYWTSFPDGDHTDPCGRLLDSPIGPTAADLAAAVSTAPGTDLVSGPSNVTLGGRPAKHLVLTVRAPVGCDPGFFFRWRGRNTGAFWDTTRVGAVIRVWIIDVHGTRLFIAAATTRAAAQDPHLEAEIQQIVGSIRFESPSVPEPSEARPRDRPSERRDDAVPRPSSDRSARPPAVNDRDRGTPPRPKGGGSPMSGPMTMGPTKSLSLGSTAPGSIR